MIYRTCSVLTLINCINLKKNGQILEKDGKFCWQNVLRLILISYIIFSVLQAHSLLTALDGSPLCCKCMQCAWGGGFLFCAACVEFIRRTT